MCGQGLEVGDGRKAKEDERGCPSFVRKGNCMPLRGLSRAHSSGSNEIVQRSTQVVCQRRRPRESQWNVVTCAKNVEKEMCT